MNFFDALIHLVRVYDSMMSQTLTVYVHLRTCLVDDVHSMEIFLHKKRPVCEKYWWTVPFCIVELNMIQSMSWSGKEMFPMPEGCKSWSISGNRVCINIYIYIYIHIYIYIFHYVRKSITCIVTFYTCKMFFSTRAKKKKSGLFRNVNNVSYYGIYQISRYYWNIKV